MAKLLSVRLRTKWFWVRIALQSLKLQILRLLRARSSLAFRETTEYRFTLKLVRDMILTYSHTYNSSMLSNHVLNVTSGFIFLLRFFTCAYYCVEHREMTQYQNCLLEIQIFTTIIRGIFQYYNHHCLQRLLYLRFCTTFFVYTTITFVLLSKVLLNICAISASISHSSS